MKALKWAIPAVVISMLTVNMVMAGSGTLTWTDPTTRADGSTFNSATDALKHTVYLGVSSSLTSTSYDSKVDIGATATTYAVTSLPSGTTYAIVTITDKQNLESDPSNIVSKFIPFAKPRACTLQFN